MLLFLLTILPSSELQNSVMSKEDYVDVQDLIDELKTVREREKKYSKDIE